MSETSTVRIGKVRGAQLPQEYELSQFIAHVDNRLPSWNISTHACEWQGVSCNSDLRVTKINWNSWGLGHSLGEVHWENPQGNELTYNSKNTVPAGPLRWDCLPYTILFCEVSGQKFTGTLPLDLLPRELTSLRASNNDFTGELNLTHLPSSLEELQLDSNAFEGCVNLAHFPSKLRIVNLSSNTFSGPIDLSCLPESLENLDLADNKFDGLVEFDEISSKLEFLNLNGNEKLYGEIDECVFLERGQNVKTKNTRIFLKKPFGLYHLI